MTFVHLRRSAQFLGSLGLAIVVLQSSPQPPPASAAQAEGKGQVITMPSYTLVSPFDKEWQVDSDDRKESIRFERVIRPSGFSAEVISSATVQVFKRRTPRDQRGLSEDKVADLYRDNEEKRVRQDLVAKESFVVTGVERGTRKIGGKKVSFLRYSASKPEVSVEALVYLYFPKDYGTRQAFYVFFLSEAFKKDKHSPDLTRIDPLLASFKALKPRDPGKPSAEELLEATDAGDLAEVKDLLDRGADVNGLNKDGWSAISLAASKGNTDLIKLLVKRGALVNVATGQGQTPLIFAAHWGHTQAITFLLDSGADINTQMGDGWTALIDAVHMDRKDAARLLIERGADVNRKTKEGWTALMTAAFKNDQDTARLLIEKGAEINARDARQNSALSLAKSKGYEDMAAMLRAAGAAE